LSGRELRVIVVRRGIESRILVETIPPPALMAAMAPTGEGASGGSVCEEDGLRRGVEVFEFGVEGGRTRFACRNEKNAVNRPMVSRVLDSLCYVHTRQRRPSVHL
jgi:hypothetical protein